MATMTFYIVPDGDGTPERPFTKWIIDDEAPSGDLYEVPMPVRITAGAPIQKIFDVLTGMVSALVKPTGQPPDSYGVVTITSPD